MVEIQGLKLYDIKQAARYKGMEYEAFRFYCNDGRGPEREMLAGRWIFTKEALDAWEKRMKPRGGYRRKRA